MSRRKEIIDRANADFRRVVDRCQAQRDEVLRQQELSLRNIPEMRSAIEAFHAAVAEADRAFRQNQDSSD